MKIFCTFLFHCNCKCSNSNGHRFIINQSTSKKNLGTLITLEMTSDYAHRLIAMFSLINDIVHCTLYTVRLNLKKIEIV